MDKAQAERMKGENNPRWNGGVSEYPNHADMKRNRLIRLKEADGKCEVCGDEAYCVHHIDGSRDNHAIDNLVVLCKKCHGILHSARINSKTQTSKYIRLYGMTMKQIAEKYGASSYYYYHLHREGKLKDFLQRAEREIESKQNQSA